MKRKRKRNQTSEQTKRYQENRALRFLFEGMLSSGKKYKRELAEIRANFAEQLYNDSEPIK